MKVECKWMRPLPGAPKGWVHATLLVSDILQSDMYEGWSGRPGQWRNLDEHHLTLAKPKKRVLNRNWKARGFG